MTKKSYLRKEYIELRNGITFDEVDNAEINLLSIVRNNSELYANKKVSCYWSIGKEFPTHELVLMLSDIGSEVYLPKMIDNSKKLKFVKTDGQLSLRKNNLGISEPIGNTEIDPNELDIIFLPCVCFDEKGYRIGMGKGYYDYSLAGIDSSSIKLIILAHEFQKIENCLPEDHDIKAHMCITEKTIYEFK